MLRFSSLTVLMAVFSQLALAQTSQQDETSLTFVGAERVTLIDDPKNPDVSMAIDMRPGVKVYAGENGVYCIGCRGKNVKTVFKSTVLKDYEEDPLKSVNLDGVVGKYLIFFRTWGASNPDVEYIVVNTETGKVDHLHPHNPASQAEHTMDVREVGGRLEIAFYNDHHAIRYRID